ncbi:MAG: cyanophycinase [Herpetosiphonaceae bacterium]|nr:cyanophycinase [Herpetosiphonaceae bacterium]
MAFDPDAPSNALDNSGMLMLIGGAEDKVGHRSVLRRFIELAGGPAARIAVVATASEIHDIVATTYHRIFTDLGVADVRIMPLYSREACDDDAILATFNDATGIFLTGGNQLKLMMTLGGTRAATRIRRVYRYGCVVAGTSAGASAVCQHMMAYGDSGTTPRKAMMHFSPGLGLISRLLVDQHFGARGRTGRLITALAHNPYLLGVGLDEDTAIEIDAKHLMHVFGRGSVMVVDAGDMSYSDLHRLPDNTPLSIFNLRMHLLTHGHSFDIATRTPLVPATPPLPFEPPTFASGEGI